MTELQSPRAALPPELEGKPGVQFNPPPAEFLTSTTNMIRDALATLEGDQRGRIVWVANVKDGKTSVNAAVVNRVRDNIDIVAFVGKEWGQPIEAGIAGTITWR